MNFDPRFEQRMEILNQTIACPCCGNQFIVVALSANNKEKYDALLQLLDEMEAVKDNRIVKDDQEYYLKYMSDIEIYSDQYKQAIKINSFMDRKNRLHEIWEETLKIEQALFEELLEKQKYIKEHFDSDNTTPECIKNCVDALRLFTYITLTYQISCRCLSAIESEDLCFWCLQKYKNLIAKRENDDKYISWWGSLKGVFSDYNKLFFRFWIILQKIYTFESKFKDTYKTS